MNEAPFASQVYDLLTRFGWRWTHSRPAWTEKGYRTAISGDAGMLDIIAVRRPRLLFIETKASDGDLAAEQAAWIEELTGCKCEVMVLWPESYTLEDLVEMLI